jgi:arylsulfatase A-like enzyme
MEQVTEHDRTIRRVSGVFRLPLRVLPNFPTLLFVLCGIGTEAVLVGKFKDNIYSTGNFGVVLLVSWLVWFWFILGWAYWGIANTIALLNGRWSRWARILVTSLVIALAFPLVISYMGSWSLYLRTGQFANMETVRIIVKNPLPFSETQVAGVYAGEMKRALFWVLGLIVILLYARWVRVPRPIRRGLGRMSSVPRFTGYALTLLLVGLFLTIRSDASVLRRESRFALLKHHLNPCLSFAASWLESVNEERVEACLDAAQLHPISKDDWRIPPTPGRDRPNIVFVKVEALRRQVVGAMYRDNEIMPNLNRLADAGLNLTRAYAPSTHTDYSDVSIMASLYPLWSRQHHYYEASDPWPRTRIYDLLKKAGYDTALFSSENEKWGCKDLFWRSPNLDMFYDAERKGPPTRVFKEDSGVASEIAAGALTAGVLDDQETTDAGIAWVKGRQSGGQPFFLYLNLQSSHFPYILPAACARPFQPSAMDFGMSFVWYPPEKVEQVYNAYCNALHESDRQLGRLVATLQELGRLQHTILAIYGDHGEAFCENGQVTHAREPIEPTARTGCVIYAPAYVKAGTEDYPVQLIDLVPTVFGLIGWPAHPGFQGINILSADRPPLNERLLFVHTENPLTRADAVVLGGRWKFVHDRQNGREALFDLASDPGEQLNEAQTNPTTTARLRSVLSEWRARQLAYYHYPFYYEHYYPPSAPRMNTIPSNGVSVR